VARTLPVSTLPFLAALDLGLITAVACGPDLLRVRDLALAGAVWLVVIGGSLTLGHLLARDSAKASLIAVLFVLAFGTMGDVSEGLRRAGTLELIGGEAAVVGLYGLILAGPVLAIQRGHRLLPLWYRYATLVLSALFAFNVFQLLRASLATLPPAVHSGIASSGPPTTRPPDIWLLVMDKYTSSPLLQAHYGLDNRPFEDWLRGRGFLLPVQHRANYPQTFLALASMLNLRYLDDYPDRFSGRTRLAAVPDIENNRLASFLRAQGYRFVFVPSAFDVARRNRYADVQMPDPADVRPEFLVRWYRANALPVVHRLACAVLGCEAGRSPYVPESGDVQEAKLHALARLVPDRPTFVLAHFLLPHEPYLYHADCSRRRPYWPEIDWGLEGGAQRRAYAEQVQCTNRRLATLVATIQRQARVPPIILIQSDHGHGRLGRPVPPLRGLPGELVEERLSPFAAYRLPGLPADSVYPGITPVNVMRLVVRHYFGADLPRLEDRVYWSATVQPFAFIRLR
jgi:hypothetical protein